MADDGQNYQEDESVLEKKNTFWFQLSFKGDGVPPASVATVIGRLVPDK